MSKLWDYFSFKSSRFSLTKSKETTARISLFRVLNIPLIYTMEASFWGASQGALKDQHFKSEDFKNWGSQLFHSLLIYSKIDWHEVIFGNKQILELGDQANEKLTYDKILEEFNGKKDELINESDADSDDGSDSEPSEDNMSDKEICKILPIKIKKRKVNQLVSQTSFKKRQRDLENKLKEKAAAKREELKRREVKSPLKRVYNYKNALKDRFNLGKIK